MNRNVVITGASRGIGLALAKWYRDQEDNVYALCRRSTQGLNGLGVKVIEGIDVSDDAVIPLLKKHFHDMPIDIVINNAGIWGDEPLGNINYSAMMNTINVNAMGPLRVVEALWDNFGSGSKLGMITSRMGSIEDNGSGGRYDYRMSKAALNAAAKSLAIDLSEEGIALAIIHPGFVQTDMVGGNGDISADTAAERIGARMEALRLHNTGTFWHSNGDVLPW